MTADELRETLRAAGYTQADYADQLGRSESFVSNLVRGRTPVQLRYIHSLREMMGSDVFDAAYRSARRCIMKGECDRAAARLSRRLSGGVRVRVLLGGQDGLADGDEEEEPKSRRPRSLHEIVTARSEGEWDEDDNLQDDDDRDDSDDDEDDGDPDDSYEYDEDGDDEDDDGDSDDADDDEYEA
ncbi:MAG: helix-turn-helix transcriptional regulator ['Candidatus Kapabacteria' thiocyanatum]|uniref:Uncharacterized protein n=1 Tax=Candidatus Kapaibacterium thiocyanatum TaxID=1895771 RepID=A0A1M3KZ49_9BACT|nr:helix-turn-helix transcriptional regulator ['Candidatus Kapabacteria' thiocyanatum]OJX57771.1 MAG: hypothetical protein BGO89_07315 ['Candidatus Kapabacteria' thiocyanatum]